MKDRFVLAIDQSTSGTKALLFDGSGSLVCRSDRPHRQMVDEKGWVEHDPEEIYRNTVLAVKDAVGKSGVDRDGIAGIGISNQRETALAWDRKSGTPVYNAVVWQCPRGEAICEELVRRGCGPSVAAATGLRLSPYFSAAKLSWILRNVPLAARTAADGNLCCGTVDSWLVFRLTHGKSFKTDYSNASRTQLFNISTLRWDEGICGLFGLEPSMLPQVCDSDGLFGETDLEGYFRRPVPIHGVLGDSHGALFGQGCLTGGMIKATYGTGSSVMMNLGEKPVFSKNGVVTSLAWGMGGKVEYVLEGNINYTGAVMKWVVEDLGLLASAKEASAVAASANPADRTYLVPAFTGLGAPYWESGARAILCGMGRGTGKAEIVRAAEECIAYQIADVVRIMAADSGLPVRSLRADGGPARDGYLMQFQSDILGIPVAASKLEELSGAGAAFAAGLALGVYDRKSIFNRCERTEYVPAMEAEAREKRLNGWNNAVGLVLRHAAASASA